MKKTNKKRVISFPKKINLLDGEYKIVLEDDKKMTNDNKLYGFSSRNAGILDRIKKIIYINKWTRSSRELTMWHELAHHFLRYYGLREDETGCDAFGRYVINCLKQLGYKK